MSLSESSSSGVKLLHFFSISILGFTPLSIGILAKLEELVFSLIKLYLSNNDFEFLDRFPEYLNETSYLAYFLLLSLFLQESQHLFDVPMRMVNYSA